MKNIWPKPQTHAAVSLCTKPMERARGLLGRSPAEDGRHVVLVPCKAVHTFGMDAPIDVAFVDKEGKVVASYERVPPGSRLSCKDACMVVERRSGGNSASWLQCGGQVFALPEQPALPEACSDSEEVL